MYDTETAQYLFDVQGYLVLEDVLGPTEIDLCNALLDRRNLKPGEDGHRFGGAPEGSGFLDWGQPFCDMLDHADIMPILRFRLGECFRLDRLYGIHMNQGMGRGKLHADYGATSPTSGALPGQYYPGRQTEILNGFVVVAWNLTETGPGLGGFCCIPGSHKASFRLPQRIQDELETCPAVVIPSIPVGAVLLFSEALTHGTTAWRGEHQRRSLLYKYCVSHMAWTSRRVQPPEHFALTGRQRLLFSEPADPLRHFPSLFTETDTPT